MPIKPSSILVTGGAGFIGSHMALLLQDAGYPVVILDNLSTGHRDAVRDAPFVEADMADKKALQSLFSAHSFSAVIHFAAFMDVAESMQAPAKYYQNNVAATLNLLDVMLDHQVNHLIFSSTAAVYGEPRYTPIDESHPVLPINPYGRSKKMVEDILSDYAKNSRLSYAVLRYFNAAGADPRGRLGERHQPESHLIPRVLAVAQGECDHVMVHGRDYPTEDGTCVRDYVHVSDLCDAHLLAWRALQEGQVNAIYNLGTEQAYSVQQVIEAARRVTKHPIPVKDGARRLGDPAILMADATRAKQELRWRPKYGELDVMIQHAWQFVKG